MNAYNSLAMSDNRWAQFQGIMSVLPLFTCPSRLGSNASSKQQFWK